MPASRHSKDIHINRGDIEGGSKVGNLGRHMLVCVMLLLVGSAFPAFMPAAAADPAPLPDLSPELFFFVGGNDTRGATAGTPVTIIVYVNNEGPGNITSANVTLSVDGSLLTVVPVVYNFSGEARYGAAYNWNTNAISPGNHTVRAEVGDSAGDADPTDNGADYKFTIARRSAGLMLDMDTPVAVAVVTESSAGIATVTGAVTVSGLDGRTMNISLTAQTDIGWTAKLSTATVRAEQNLRFPFSADVTVPQGTAAARYGKIVISAYGQTQDDNLTATVEAIIEVRPYYRVSLDSGGAYRSIDPGSMAFFTVKLTNSGNAVDSYEVEISNLLELVDKGWTVVLSANTLAAVGPGDHKTIAVSAQAPQDWTLSRSESTLIVINVTSQGARDLKQNVSLEFKLYAQEKGSYPAWYNASTIGVLAVLLVVATAAAVWMRTRKHDRASGPEGDE